MANSKLREWRLKRGLTLVEAARILGFEGGGGASRVQRYEEGSVWPPATALNAIIETTAGEVTADDMLETRLGWIGSSAAPEADRAGTAPEPTPSAVPAHLSEIVP